MTNRERVEPAQSQLHLVRRRAIQLSVLGGFTFHSDERTPATLAREAQRLLALLALLDRPVSRAAVAGTLWPEASSAHAYASLRSALSRLVAVAQDAIVITDSDLALAPGVAIDLRDARALAHRLLAGAALPATPDGTADAIRALSADCLPDWYEDWAMIESEQLRLHALDALTLHLTAAGRFGDAVEAAGAAMRSEPLRESACAGLMRAHLAEGNQSEAIRAFEQYRALLARELGIEPTPALEALLPRRRLP